MKIKTAKSQAPRAAKPKVVRLVGTAIPTLGRGLVLVRTSASGRISDGRRTTEGARVVVTKVGKALNRPGINKRKVVFRDGEVGGIFAYSVDPQDPTKVVREAFDGTRRSGRLVGGRFKAK